MASGISFLLFRAKVLKILWLELRYKPDLRGTRKRGFYHITHSIRSEGGNEYDAALVYMLEALEETLERWQQGSTLPVSERQEYLKLKLDTIRTLLPRSQGLAEARLHHFIKKSGKKR